MNAARRGRLLAGGLIGAVVVLDRQLRRHRGPLPGGLRAFEDAPCFREEQRAERPRAGSGERGEDSGRPA